MEWDPSPAIGARIRLALSVGSMSWHGHVLACPRCGATERWGLAVWSLADEWVVRASGLCGRWHWVDHPLITPELVSAVVAVGQSKTWPGETGQQRLDDAVLGWSPSAAIRGTGEAAGLSWREPWPPRGMDRHQWDQWPGANGAALLATVEAVREGIAHAAAHRVQAAPDSIAPSPDAGLEDRIGELAQLHAELAAARDELARAAQLTANDTEPSVRVTALYGKVQRLSDRIAVLSRTIPGPTARWPGGWVLERVGADSTHRQFLGPRDFDKRDHRVAWSTPDEAAAAATPKSARRLPLRVSWTAAAAPAVASLAS